MRVSELRAREDFEQVFRQTLQHAWSVLLHRDTRVLGPGDGGQVWYRAWPFDLYHVKRPAVPVRRFMRRLFQFDRRLWRLPAHVALAGFASSWPGLDLLSRAEFSLEPAVPQAAWKAVVAGNQRIRIFDFQTTRIRVAAKLGFSGAGMADEVAFRTGPDRPDFVPAISAWDFDAGWFEEPLLEQFVPLPRLAPWRRPGRLGGLALRRVEDWSARQGWRLVEAGEWVEGILERIRSLPSWAESRVADDLESAVGELARHASGLGRVEVGWTHGDFQPGNILAHVGHDEIKVIDWEHRAQRYVFYDRVVYETALRWGGDLRQRFVDFLHGRTGHDRVLPDDVQTRRSILAMVVVEDILWRMEQAQRGGFEPEWAAMERVVRAYP